jgi:hypothetical protein
LREALKIYDELAARRAISAEYAHVPDRIKKELPEVEVILAFWGSQSWLPQNPPYC